MFGRIKEGRLQSLLDQAVREHPEVAPEVRAFNRALDGARGIDPYERERNEAMRAAREFSRSRMAT